MAEEKQESKTVEKIGSDSKLMKTFLVILAAFLTFAGPTFIVYALLNMLKMDYTISMASGFILFIVGLILIWYLIRKQTIS